MKKSMKPRRAIAMTLWGCAFSLSAVAAEVSIDGLAFKPGKITVQPGETVTWTSDTSSSHTVVVSGVESQRLRKGAQFSHTFTAPGEYPYQCGVHRSMKGVVVVTDADLPSSSPSSLPYTSSALRPLSVNLSATGPTYRDEAAHTAAEAGTTGTTASVDNHADNNKASKANDGKAKIMIVDFMRFEPAEITVKAGTTVVFDNHDGSNHIILFDDQVKSLRLRHHASYSRTFDSPGKYPFICAIHGKRMSGAVHVVP